ncbi:type II secretion system protein G [Methylobacillus sp. MM3]|jgi:general secretion pathway protein G|uniref:type II secretion system protein n=1 Tax=Methylobacillus sp. MM3 TaxID=1848039 RepID=UPI0007E1EA5E|nr:prepilin-type N-terminal cleavage/methylation domain-containing protein [Methylobacillus sp. MM3]OAJ71880.1 type II secretion system protein G [Methylobacillus sp. MM3]
MALPTISGKRRGFTLIELAIVMAMIALLLTFALPRYFDGLERAKEAALRQDLKTMRDAIEQFHADRGIYPELLEDLVTQRYLHAVPVDPISESPETWMATPPPEPERGMIYDIYSGAEGQAQDGTYYAEW